MSTVPTWQSDCGRVALYLGDCLEVLPRVARVDSIITDPVWPTCPDGLLQGSSCPEALLRHSLELCHCHCAVIVMGFDCDPRFLEVVPSHLPFIRSQQLPYAMPGYRGRLLGGDEVAYVFGSIPRGRGLIPGRAPTETSAKAVRANGHPCPRSLTHFCSLTGWWSREDDIVLDPFMGSGTTGVACIRTSRRFIGIEIEPRYFEIAKERIQRELAQPFLIAPEAKAMTQEAFA